MNIIKCSQRELVRGTLSCHCKKQIKMQKNDRGLSLSVTYKCLKCEEAPSQITEFTND